MQALARRRALLAVALLTLIVVFGCGKKEVATFGKVLPADTLAWLHLEDLPALEGALESYGLMDALVAELDTPEARAELEAEMGLVLDEDPRVTIHALMQELVRADVSAHAPLHEGAEDPVVVTHLECVDEAAAIRVVDMVSKHADAEITVGIHAAFRFDTEGGRLYVMGRHGAHVLMASEAETWGAMMGAVIDPPPSGLVDTEAYQRVKVAETMQISAYLTPEFQSEFRGLGMPHQLGMDPAVMAPLMEKYGSQYAHLTADYVLSKLVAREALTVGSPLEPLMVCADGEPALMSWLPAGTFVYEGWLVENGRAKLELIAELLKDTMATMNEIAPGQMPPGSEDPLMAAEAMLGFSLADLAERVREVAIAGAESPGWLLMMRAHDETQAQELADMIGGIPMLGMLAEGPPVTVGETTLRSFGWPNDESGKLQLLGRHGDTMLMAFQVPDAAAMEAFLGQTGSGGFVGAVPAHASRQLKHGGCGWGYLDLAGLLSAFEEDPFAEMDDVPPALAARLRTLRAAGHMTMKGGVAEMVMEMGAP